MIRELYQTLHDKFGFSQKRIIRVEQTIETYLGDAEKDGMSAEELGYFMKTKCGIDVREETNKIPYRESFYLVERKIAPSCMIQANKFLLAQVFNYFAMLGVCLKTKFKFSSNQIRQVYERIRYLINCIATGYETMAGIASVLEHECKYIDKEHFAKYEDETVYTWDYGKTSWSTYDGKMSSYKYAMLPESEDQNENKQD